MFAVVALLALFAAICGLISVIVPLRFLKIRSRPQGFATLVAGLVGFGWAANQLPPPAATTPALAAVSNDAEPAAAAPAKADVPAPAPAKVAVAAPALPADQQAMIEAVREAKKRYDSAGSDLAKGSARPMRKAAICSAVRSARVNDWLGTVSTLTTNSEGKGVLQIAISDLASVRTWNNAISDVGSKTLIEPGSALYNQALQLSAGQKVKFSGTFMRSDVDCVQEASMTLNGSLTEPEFVFRFSEVRAVD